MNLQASEVVDWAICRWRAEVANRPMQNIHRRSLDTTWRQVIRQFGGDDVVLCGPPHNDLAALSAGQKMHASLIIAALEKEIQGLKEDNARVDREGGKG